MDTSLGNRILFEDNHLIILNKHAGELVQGDKTGDPSLADKVMAFIKERDAKPGNVFLGIPHRLDRPVSGIVVYAKTSKGLSRMTDLFRVRNIMKTYWAIVEAAPKAESGRVVSYLRKNVKQNKSYSVTKEKEGYKKSVLNYRQLKSSDRYHLIKVDLETGRHHQIRVQLSDMGCIIKGDLKYGASRSNKDGSISLHARHVEFIHPVSKEEITITAPCPSDALWEFFERT